MDENDSSLVEPLLYRAPNKNVSEIIEEINPKNAKRVAVLLILLFIFYHAYIHVKYGMF